MEGLQELSTELAGIDLNLPAMGSTSNLSSVMDWKNPERTIFRLAMHATNTFLSLRYEDEDYDKQLASAQFQNFVLGVNVGTQVFRINASLGRHH